MDVEERNEGFGEYGEWLIGYKARQLVGREGFTESDREDLEQELRTDLLVRLPKYAAVKASRKTYVARLVNHKVATIIEAQRAGKRDWRRVCSLDEVLTNGDGEPVERSDTIDQEEYLRRTGQPTWSEAEEQRDLVLDLKKLLAELPPDLRQLCRRVESADITQVSRETGFSRATIYDRIKKVRAVFEDAGLRDYL